MGNFETFPHNNQPKFMVEPLPENFVPRLAEYEAVVEALTESALVRPVGITAALRGAGGYGKTTLAKAVCHDLRVRNTFPDGVFWVTLGERPSKSEQIAKIEYVVSKLTGVKEDLPDIHTASARLHEELIGRQALLVVDDVWHEEHLTPFLQPGQRCALLITTRNDNTLPVGTKKIVVDAMQTEEAVKLLQISIITDSEELNSQQLFIDLVRWLGKCPLLINLANAILRRRIERGESPKAATEALYRALKRKGLEAFNLDDAVKTMLKLSVELLTKVEQELFQMLAVFAEDVDIPLEAVEVLWGNLGKDDAIEVEELCMKLADHSLLLRLDFSSRILRLHDVIRKYLLGKQGKRISGLHRFLLDGYFRKCPSGWSTGPKDGYFFRWLTYHMSEADHFEELADLLIDYRWMDNQLRIGGIKDLLADYGYFINQKNEHSETIAQIQNALRLSSHVLAKDPNQLAGQLIARMLSIENEGVKNFIEQIKEVHVGKWLRPIFQCLPPPNSTEIRTFEVNSKYVHMVHLCEDDHILITVDDYIRVWDLQSGDFICLFEDSPKDFQFVNLSPNGKLMITGCKDGIITIWDISKWEAIHQLKGEVRAISCSAISNNGQVLILGCHNGTIQLYDLTNVKEIRNWKAHEYTIHGRGGIQSLLISPDNRLLVSSGSDNLIKLWDLSTGNLLYTLTGHSSWVTALAFSPDGHNLISGGLEIIEWELDSGLMKRIIGNHPYGVCSLAINPSKNFLVSGGNDYLIRIWDLRNGREINSIEGHLGEVTGVAVTQDGRTIISGAIDGKIKLWDLQRLEPNVKFDNRGEYIFSVAISPDGGFVATGSIDERIRVWEISTGKVMFTCLHGGWVETVAYSSDGRFLYSGSEVGLKVWDSRNGELITDFEEGLYSVTKVVASKSDHCIAYEDHRKCIDVWDINKKQITHTFRGFDEYHLTFAISSDNNFLAIQSGRNTIVIYDLISGEINKKFEGNFGFIRSIIFSPDGKSIVLGGDNQTIQSLDIENGKVILNLNGPSRVDSLSISQDGRFLVSASADNLIKLWDFNTGILLAQFSCYGNPTSCTMTPDGKMIIAADEAGIMYFLHFEDIGNFST